MREGVAAGRPPSRPLARAAGASGRGGRGSACGEGTGRRGPGLLTKLGAGGAGPHAGPGSRRGGACERRRRAAAGSGPVAPLWPPSLLRRPSPRGSTPSAAGRGSWALWGRRRGGPPARGPQRGPGPDPRAPGTIVDAVRGLPADRRREAGRGDSSRRVGVRVRRGAVPGSLAAGPGVPGLRGDAPPSWEARSVPGNCPNTRRCGLVKQAPVNGFQVLFNDPPSTSSTI